MATALQTSVLFNALLAVLGFGLHVATKWMGHRANVKAIGLVAFVRAFPAQHLVSVISVLIAFLFVWAMGWLNPAAAISSGYAAKSIVESAIKRTQEVVGHK